MDSSELLAGAAGPFLAEIRAVASELVKNGWAEANAGNISFRLPGVPDFAGSDHPLPDARPELGGRALLVKTAGTRMRDLAEDPCSGLCLLCLNEAGTAYRLLDNRQPTSEMPTHLAVHSALVRTRPEHICVLHTHPTGLIALSSLYPEPESLLAKLVRAHVEVQLFRPKLEVLPFIAPGTENLGAATGKAFEEHSGVIWPRHGMVASGSTPAEALDLIEVADKAARIALLSGAPVGPLPADTKQKHHRPPRGQPLPEGIETFFEVRSRDSSLSPEEFGRLPRRPIHVVLDNLRSAFNVGSVFRIADAVRAEEVIPCGYTCCPPHHKLEQAALGTTGSVPWRRFETTNEALVELRSRGIQLVALETAEDATPYDDFDFRRPVAIVLGNESLGVSQSVLRMCDGVIDIPVFGFKNSINVAAAAAVVLYDLVRRYDWL